MKIGGGGGGVSLNVGKNTGSVQPIVCCGKALAELVT